MPSFQIIDYKDLNVSAEDPSASPTADESEERYVVRVFGRTSPKDTDFPDKSVCLTLTGFRPYFYLRVPTHFSPSLLKDWFRFSRRLKNVEVGRKVLYKDFDGFQAGHKRCFVKISSASSYTTRKAAQVITKALRLELDVWVDKETDENGVRKILEERYGSAEGVAEIIRGEVQGKVCCRVRYTNQASFMKVINRNRDIYPNIEKFERELRNDPEYRLYESNIDPVLRLMHSIGIRGCSWVKVPNGVLTKHTVVSMCDLEGEISWERVSPDVDKEEASETARFRVMSYDIETMSSDENGGFPQASRDGDYVIQIGITMNYFQHQDCYKYILLSLKECDPIEGVVVQSYEDERELLRAFVKILEEEDPDVITGYNIFGFDNVYLKDRAVKLGIGDEFSFWSRLRESCAFKEKKLSSSALGDNRLYFYESSGRVQVDLFKVVQRDYNLPSYKLDFVSSYFNQNSIKEVGNGYFVTSGVSGIDVGGYVSLKVFEENSCGVEDDYPGKFQVKDIQAHGKLFKVFCDGQLPTDMEGCELRWCMAKDDLPPKKIFEYWPIDPHHRSIIGKYCIKDTYLVAFLMEKLDILSNNCAMSNVSFVPLPYIFLRGQGIKALSLVAERCKQDGYLIPTVSKEELTNHVFEAKDKSFISDYGDSDVECTYDGCGVKGRLKLYEGGVVVCGGCSRVQYYSAYQGARVIDPEPGIHWDPIAVLDYASLYPSSIIAKNISWETIVQDPVYDNTEGYYFHEVKYVETTTGKEIVCRYAQAKDGSYGVIPKMLRMLLDERSRIKKLLKKETNPFKKRILDGQQLAMKLTGNSTYGQMGALTSAIHKTQLAACTTAVGQNMLTVAQNFIEKQFVPMLEELPSDHWARQYLPLQPKVVYGDSVVGDTPLIIKCSGRIRTMRIDELVMDHQWKPWGDKEVFIGSASELSVWSDTGFIPIKKVIRHKCRKPIVRVVTPHGEVDCTTDHSLVDKQFNRVSPNDVTIGTTDLLHCTYDSLFDHISHLNASSIFHPKGRMRNVTGELIVPPHILNAPTREEVCAWLKDVEPRLPIKDKGKEYYLGLNLLRHRCGLNPRVEGDYVVYIKEMPCNGEVYVYDLETESGHFHVGPYDLVVHNTDSVFCTWNLPKEMEQREKREVTIRLGQLAGELVKPLLDKPQDLEYEKVFHPWIVLTKKRYVGLKYEFDPDKYSISMMGICIKRRDFCRIVKKVCGGILHRMMFESSKEKIIEFVQAMIQDIIDGKFSIQDFVLSKRLRSEYANPDILPHVALAKRMTQRDPAQAPQVGDRLSYVTIYNPKLLGKKNILQAERVEELGYVIDNNLKVDYVHYITNQVMRPACQFLSLITDSPEKVIFDPIIAKEVKRRYREKNQKFVDYFKKKE